MSARVAVHHSERRLPEPPRWVIHLSHVQPVRLVVFVHGFGGSAVRTWRRFPESGRERAWWREADMLFAGYDSKRDTITGAAHRLRKALPRFYPTVDADLLTIGGVAVREPVPEPYRELVLVGHSLGGVVVRRALTQAAERWLAEGKPQAGRPPLLDAQVRFFSPASGGFRAAGRLGMMRAAPMWPAIEMILRRSSAYSDLQPASELLQNLRTRTERLAADPDLAALRAHIAWANPEDVVLSERYETDHPDDSIDRTDHSSVCKPRRGYEAPWEFVETGLVP